MANRSYYEILGVKTSAEPEEIRRAYFALAAICHPDHANGDAEKMQRFKDAANAYATLSDPKKRRIYDSGYDGEIQTVTDVFLRTEEGRNLMQAMIPSAPAAKMKGKDHLLNVEVPARLLETGGVITRSLALPHGGMSDISIEIPPKAYQYPWCRIQQFGGKGKNGAPPGDLWIHFHPKSKQSKK